jgi:general secretion pathway protein I
VGGDMKQRNNSGFTLIEILVALAILSIVVITVVKNTATTISNAGYLRDRTFAHWVAMNKAAELQLAGQWPAQGQEQGEVELANRAWRWSAVFKETPDPDVRRVAISVAAAENIETVAPLTTLVVYLARPPT